MTTLQEQFTTAFPHLSFQLNYPLATKTYFKVGGPAELYLELAEREQIIALVQFCQKNQLPMIILGGGSNVIVADKGLDGLVLKLTNSDFSIVGKQNNETIIRAGAGLRTTLLVRKTIDAGLTGLEYFLGVPGNLGGAVFNNAHYLQDLISEYIWRVEIINKTGEAEWLDNKECEFGYDSSRFQRTGEVILQAELHLSAGLAEESQKLIKQATLIVRKLSPWACTVLVVFFKILLIILNCKNVFLNFAAKSN